MSCWYSVSDGHSLTSWPESLLEAHLINFWSELFIDFSLKKCVDEFAVHVSVWMCVHGYCLPLQIYKRQGLVQCKTRAGESARSFLPFTYAKLKRDYYRHTCIFWRIRLRAGAAKLNWRDQNGTSKNWCWSPWATEWDTAWVCGLGIVCPL